MGHTVESGTLISSQAIQSPFAPAPTQQFKLFQMAAPECNRRPTHVRVVDWTGSARPLIQRAAAPVTT
jgi:hypothetical protein